MENHAENVYQRLFPDPFLTSGNNTKKPLHARNSFKNKIFWKRIISFFLSNPIPFNGKSYLKQKGSGTSDQSLFRLKNNSRKIPLLVLFYVTKFDDTIRDFWVLQKVTPANLCKPVHDIINYSTCICSFESGKCGKKGKKCKTLNISRTKRAF